MLKDRLDLIISELGLSGRQFEKECGLPNGSYSSISDGIGANKLKQIHFKFPQISLEWLIAGEGEMLKKTGENKAQISNLDEKYLKILEINARTMESQQKTIADLTAKLAGNEDAADAQGVARKAAKE